MLSIRQLIANNIFEYLSRITSGWRNIWWRWRTNPWWRVTPSCDEYFTTALNPDISDPNFQPQLFEKYVAPEKEE